MREWHGSATRRSRSLGICGKPRSDVAQGQSVGTVCRNIGITEQDMLPGWRREYGGLKLDQAKRLKELEQENNRLKRAVSELTLDKLILKETITGKY